MSFEAIGSAPIGATPISGGMGNLNPVVYFSPAIISINGNQIGNWRDLNITDTLQKRGTAKFSFIDYNKNLRPAEGQKVEIVWNGKLIFSGLVNKVQTSSTDRNDAKDVSFHTVNCVDWNALLDKEYVSAVYENMTVGAIVLDILQNETKMQENGIFLGIVASEFVIQKITFNLVTASKAIQDVCEASGLTYNTDYYKTLHLLDRSTLIAPYTIGDLGRKNYHDIGYSTTIEQYRNVEILRAGYDLTNKQTEHFHGDPDSIDPQKRNRKWQLTYEMGEGVIPVIKRNGVIQRVGIRSVDKDGDLTVPSPTTWVQFFYAPGEKEITQNNVDDEILNPTVISTDDLEVTYYGRYRMIVYEYADTEISSRKAIEGGTGEYHHVDEDTDLNGRELGKTKAQKYLEIYGRIPGTLELNCYHIDFEVGHILTITDSSVQISAVQFMVDSLQITMRDPLSIQVKYTLLDSAKQQDWIDYWKKYAESKRQTVIRENEVVIKTSRMLENLQFHDVLHESIHDSVTLLDYTKDPYSYAMWGYVTVAGTGELVPSWVWGRSKFGKPYGL